MGRSDCCSALLQTFLIALRKEKGKEANTTTGPCLWIVKNIISTQRAEDQNTSDRGQRAGRKASDSDPN